MLKSGAVYMRKSRNTTTHLKNLALQAENIARHRRGRLALSEKRERGALRQRRRSRAQKTLIDRVCNLAMRTQNRGLHWRESLPAIRRVPAAHDRARAAALAALRKRCASTSNATSDEHRVLRASPKRHGAIVREQPTMQGAQATSIEIARARSRPVETKSNLFVLFVQRASIGLVRRSVSKRACACARSYACLVSPRRRTLDGHRAQAKNQIPTTRAWRSTTTGCARGCATRRERNRQSPAKSRDARGPLAAAGARRRRRESSCMRTRRALGERASERARARAHERSCARIQRSRPLKTARSSMRQSAVCVRKRDNNSSRGARERNSRAFAWRRRASARAAASMSGRRQTPVVSPAIAS